MPKRDLVFDPPIMNAAGTLGFAPDPHAPIDWSRLGAFVTNPISLNRRTPAHGKRFVAYPGGFLLHTGYPNPGISSVTRHYGKSWERSQLPVIVHLLGQVPEEVKRMVSRLEVIGGVAGVEVGVNSEASPELVTALTQAAIGELPVILRLPMERSLELAALAIQAGANAISLAPPRGVYPTQDGALIQGRLYGPSILPMALKAVQELIKLGVPTIAAGGVYSQEQCDALLTTGALAVQIDGALWRSVGYKVF